MSNLTRRWGRERAAPFSWCVLVLVLFVTSRAGAQSAEELQAAAEAFQEGQRAQIRGDYARAAEMFDLANHTAPSAAALRSAIRMHQSAGHHASASTRAAHALASYPEDAATVTMANEVLAGCAPLVGHLVVRCEPACALTVGGRAVSGETTAVDLYVDPGHHVVRASWGDRSVEQAIDASPASEHALAMNAAEATSAAGPTQTGGLASTASESGDPARSSEGPATGEPRTPTGGGGGISPAYFAIAAGLTFASLATTVGVGLDMLSARDAYVLMPTETSYLNGVGRETATNALIGTTIGLAVVSVVVAILTDWDGEGADSSAAWPTLRLAVAPSVDGVFATLSLDL